MMQNWVRVKFCGMTRIVDLKKAGELGVDAVGFIFDPESIRCIDLDLAKKLYRAMPVFVKSVGVFVNPSFLEVEHILKNIPLDYLQFHGEEEAQFCQQFNRPYIKSVPALSREHIQNVMDAHPHAEAYLLDTPVQSRGGSGIVFDWSLIPDFASKPIILAGGLNSTNIEQALSCNIMAVDVCSGIEESPGLKDAHKMMQVITVLRRRNERTFTR
jgi:phosphoribosylanthranilate isomerase